MQREAVFAEMGVAVKEDGDTVGVFSPKKVVSYFFLIVPLEPFTIVRSLTNPINQEMVKRVSNTHFKFLNVLLNFYFNRIAVDLIDVNGIAN